MPISDIRISGDYVEGSFDLLPLSGERARASLFFARLVGTYAQERNFEFARWYFRAALSEFRSIFYLLNADLKAKGLAKRWERSDCKDQLDADLIVFMLQKIRDFAVH